MNDSINLSVNGWCSHIMARVSDAQTQFLSGKDLFFLYKALSHGHISTNKRLAEHWEKISRRGVDESSVEFGSLVEIKGMIYV